jgi:Polyketide cyclase / dehydrase and lipid transport
LISVSWSIGIDRPPEAVFDFVSDLDNEPKFNPDASQIVKKSDGPIGLGTVWEEEFKRIGKYETTIDRFDRPSALGFDAKNPKCDAHVLFNFEPDGTGTRVSCTVDLTFKGFSRALEPVIGGTIRKTIEDERGPALKAAVEAGP